MSETSGSYFEFNSEDKAFETAEVYSNRLGYDTQIYEIDSKIWLCRYVKRAAVENESSAQPKIYKAKNERTIVRAVLVSSPDLADQSKDCIFNECSIISEFPSESSAIASVNNTVKAYKQLNANSANIVQPEVCAFKLCDDLWIVRMVLGPAKAKKNEKNSIGTIPNLAKGLALRAFSFGRYGAVLYKNCPMSNREKIPLLFRVLSIKYRYVLSVFISGPKTDELMITHEKLIFSSPCMCVFTNDGKHVNYGELRNNVSEEEFLDSAFEIVKAKYREENLVIHEVALKTWHQ